MSSESVRSELKGSSEGLRGWWDSLRSSTRRLSVFLGGLIAFILVASVGSRVVAKAVRSGDELGTADTISGFFNVDMERNFPTSISGILFVAAAAFSLLAGLRSKGRPRWAWLFFAAATLAMAWDEVFVIHERLLKWVGESAGLESGGTLYFVWVVPGFVLAIGMVLVAVWLTKSLERWQRLGALAAAIIFFTGALGVESLTGILFADGGASLAYVLLQTVEEGLEFTGTSLMFVIAYESYQRLRSI